MDDLIFSKSYSLQIFSSTGIYWDPYSRLLGCHDKENWNADGYETLKTGEENVLKIVLMIATYAINLKH